MSFWDVTLQTKFVVSAGSEFFLSLVIIFFVNFVSQAFMSFLLILSLLSGLASIRSCGFFSAGDLSFLLRLHLIVTKLKDDLGAFFGELIATAELVRLVIFVEDFPDLEDARNRVL